MFLGRTKPDVGKKSLLTAYTPLQVARVIMSETKSNPNISARTIWSIVMAKQIYKRQPPDSHYRSVRIEFLRHMNASRAVDMDILEGYAELLRKCGHNVRIFIIYGLQMKQQRIKSEKYIFDQCKKSNNIPTDAAFDKDVIDMSDITDNGRYYGGLLFVPRVAAQYCELGRMTTAADAAHCDVVGPQSYGTTFEVVTYDTNRHLLPVFSLTSLVPNATTTGRLFSKHARACRASTFQRARRSSTKRRALKRRSEMYSKTRKCS